MARRGAMARVLAGVLALVIAPLAALDTGARETRAIVDSAGRTVEVPLEIDRVFPAGPPADVVLYALKPDAMIGWVRRPNETVAALLLAHAAALPTVGRVAGGADTVSLEALLAHAPDIILDFGTVDDGYVAAAERVQRQTGIPYLLIDGSFDATAASLRLLGDILGVRERAEALAQYTERTLAEVDRVLSGVGTGQRHRVYLARGPHGLESGARGSINTAIIERAGGVNVVDTGVGGVVGTSPEQLIRWAPDTILALDPRFAAHARERGEWRSVPAVARGRIFTVPGLPFPFVDAPPSVNRVIGLHWMLHVLYPDAAQGDLRETVREFYRLFYHVEPDTAQLDRILGH